MFFLCKLYVSLSDGSGFPFHLPSSNFRSANPESTAQSHKIECRKASVVREPDGNATAEDDHVWYAPVAVILTPISKDKVENNQSMRGIPSTKDE
jgi:hypothetical protein